METIKWETDRPNSYQEWVDTKDGGRDEVDWCKKKSENQMDTVLGVTNIDKCGVYDVEVIEDRDTVLF